jgi:putative spermidine/putrescine transport system substrate-binding protein
VITRRALAAAMSAASAGLPRPSAAQAESVVVGSWEGDFGRILQQSVDVPLARPARLMSVQDLAPPSIRRAELIAERRHRRGSVDLAGLPDVDMFELARMELFEPVPEARVRRLRFVLPALRLPYAVPQLYSVRVILYNPEKVDPPPRRYAELWESRFAGRIGLLDELAVQYVETAALAGGGSVSDFGPAWERLREWKRMGARVYGPPSHLRDALKSGEVWATVGWLAQGYLWQKEGVPVRHAVPEEGATSITYEWAVPRNAVNKDGAWRYCSLLLEREAQIAFAARLGYLPVVADVTLPEALESRINLTEAERSRVLRPDFAYLAANARAVRAFWNGDFKA